MPNKGKSILLALLILCSVCSVTWCWPKWYYLIPGLRWWDYNRLDDVLGEAELILGAEHRLLHVQVSPNGRWLFANRSHGKNIMVADLEKREYYILYLQAGHLVWLDDHHVYSDGSPKILRVPDFVWWELEFINTDRPNPDSLEGLTQAEHIFVINFGGSSDLVTTDPNFPYNIGVNWDVEEAAKKLSRPSAYDPPSY